MFRSFSGRHPGDHKSVKKYETQSTTKFSDIILVHCSKSWYLEQRTEV